DEVIIEAENVPPIPKEADGLQPVGAGGIDNTQIGLSVNIVDNHLKISTVLKGEATYKLRIPRELGLQTKGNNDCYCNEEAAFLIKGLTGDIEVKSNQRDLEIIDVTGPIVAQSQRGKIKIVFSDKMPEKPSSIAASSDNIDITVPEKANVLFSVAVRQGNFFTDVDLKPYNPPAKPTTKENTSSKGSDSWDNPPAKPTTRENVLRTTESLAQMQASVAQYNTEGYAFPSSNDAWFNSSNSIKYSLNEPKTLIGIQATQGNVYLRKKK
ncbi:MAG: hypothetical protein EAZ80_04535, partial [Runella slithyformis]